ncbi:MAG TPA: Glu-tRNA(Gln) amidotransferase subunit GatD [Candidatus Nanoarchaeia archaeon]|nr:Glu-tRNA(Gln) amidotransferase subunit GatD [Candidatus Nanoarchaeia archaeon]
MPDAGDLIEIVTADEIITGRYVPQQDEDVLIIKLDSGYNIGIEKRKVTAIKVRERYQQPSRQAEKAVQRSGLPRISVLHTGGTIASRVDYATGAVKAQFSPEELLQAFPEIGEIAQVSSRLVANIMSENVRFAHYNVLAKAVQKEIADGAAGIIVTHGTDTLHYSAAALSFVLEHLPVPVILVGAQRSSDRGSSDAALNLLSAAYFITQQPGFAEVAICMHENLDDEACLVIPGCKARKMHTSRRDAFRPVNAAPVARVSIKERRVEMLAGEYRGSGEGKLELRLFQDRIKVALLTAHPHMLEEEIAGLERCDGVVIAGTGLGHIGISPDDISKENTKIGELLQRLAKKAVVVMAPQAVYGRVNMDVYSVGRALQGYGILPAEDMTPETAFIKLAWLLSNYPVEEAKLLMGKNLRGEITERTEERAFLR